ncbi:MAG: PEP-CTERM sorting domain-containing protein [Verrucomicrobia bacterium]|nr:PEP-CTERM sorting domain-containing protein [Verrucomicrobiota bacterium]
MRVLIAALLAVSAAASTKGGPLRNLGFEEAITNNVQFFTNFLGDVHGVGPITDLVPGWQVFQGTNAVTSIWFNGPVGGNGDIIVTLNDEGLRGFPGVREGKFDLFVGGTLRPLTLRQTGEIPADAGYLVFNQSPFLFTPFVNGEPLPIASADSPHPFLIAPYAGQTVELAFALASPGSFSGGTIDDIRFLPIPEPSAFGLLVLGGLLFGARICCRRQKR